MASRQRHSDSRIEAVMAEAELHGWTFTFSNNKFHGRCGCGNHVHTIQNGGRPSHRSDKNFRSQVMQCPAWAKGGK